MKWMDKLKGTIKVNKKTLLFFTILLIIGIIAGSIFMAILSETDKKLVTDYFNNYISNIENNKLNYLESIKNGLFNNLLYIIIIWILGISIIGIPIVTIMFFIKSFTLGFSIASIVFNYKFKYFIYCTNESMRRITNGRIRFKRLIKINMETKVTNNFTGNCWRCTWFYL